MASEDTIRIADTISIRIPYPSWDLTNVRTCSHNDPHTASWSGIDDNLDCTVSTPCCSFDMIKSAIYRAVLLSAMDAIITIDDEQNIAFFNHAAETMFGMTSTEAIGLPLAKLIPEASRGIHEQHVQFFRNMGVTGRKMGALGAVSGRRSNGELFRIEAGISQATVDGQWFATVVLRDITERLATEEARNLLAQEVDHRAKNVLTVVNAIVKLTTADSIEQYVEAIGGRFDTLVRAHSLLAKAKWTGGDLRKIVEEELLGFHADSQVRFDGPALTLSAKSVQPLSMVVHELATNAVKYGALSVLEGTIAIRWTISPSGSLVLSWTETGGPATQPPARQGFGSNLIESLSEQLRGRITSDWHKSGLQFSIELPAEAFVLRRQSIRVHNENSSARRETEGGRSVLVVEDEAIVALVLAAGLRSDGWRVIGPVSTIEDAYLRLCDETAPDVVLLDLNLDGQTTYPLAHYLEERYIPFAFYSGYSSSRIDNHFKHVPLIMKPARIHAINSQLADLLDHARLAVSRP